MYKDKLVCEGLYKKIDDIFTNNGYSHRLRIQLSEQRFIIWFEDINNYHVREFGRMSFEKSVIFLTAYLHGLETGLL